MPTPVTKTEMLEWIENELETIDVAREMRDESADDWQQEIRVLSAMRQFIQRAEPASAREE